MPTLAQLGVEIDPTGAKTGGALAEDAINRIAAAADKMAAAVDRFSEVAQKSGTQGATAMQKVGKAADQATTSLKESGAAAQTAGSQTTTAATAAVAATTRTTESVEKLAGAHASAGAAAETAGSLTVTGATEGIAAQNRLAEAVEGTAVAHRNVGTVAADAMEAMGRGAQMQVTMTAEATQAAQALNSAWTQVAENHWTQQTENGLVNIIDSSMALTARTKEQVDAEFALLQAVRSRETASTSANRAYADQMNASATAAMKGGGPSADDEAAAAERAATTYRKQAEAARQEAADSVYASQQQAESARQLAENAAAARQSGDVPGAQSASAGAADATARAKAAADAAKEMAEIAKEAYKDAADAAKAAGTDAANVEKEAAADAAAATKQFAIDAVEAYKQAAQAAKEAAADATGAVKDAAAAQAQAEKEAAAVAAQAAKDQAAAEKAAAAQMKADAKDAADAAAALAKKQADAFEAANKGSFAGTSDNLHELSSLLFGLAPLFGNLQGQISSTAGLLSAAALGFSKVTGTAGDQQEKMKTLTAAYERLNVANAQVASLSKDATTSAEQLAAAQSEQAVAAGAAAAAEDAAAASTGFLLLAAIPLVAILAAAAVAALAFAAAWKFVSSSIAAGSQFVTLHARFSQFVGDAKAARIELENLEDLSAKSGLDLPQLVQGEQHLIAFGAGLKEASQEIQNFAAISERSGKDSIQALETLYATARDQGSVTMRQVMQLRTANVDLMPQLRAQTGLTGVQLQHMLSQGNISFDQLKQAIDATAASMNSLGIRAQTPEGVMDSIAAHYHQLKEEFGAPISLALVPLLQSVDDKLKSFLPDAESAGTFVGNMITSVNGAIKNGELGSLIYEVITEGTSKGWSYVDKNWFEPAKAAIADVFGAAHFGDAARATFDNLGALVQLWFSEGALKIYAYLMQFLYNFEDAIANSGIPGTGSANEGIDPHSRTADQIYGQGVTALLEEYKRNVQQNNDDFSAKMRRAGIETGELTGAFGSAVKAIDIFVAKATGAPIPKPLPMNATGLAGNQDGLSLPGILRSVFLQSPDQQGLWTMLLRNPPESMVKAYAEHNAMVVRREFESIFANDPLLSALFKSNPAVPAAPTGAQVPFMGAALPAEQRPPAVVPQAFNSAMPVKRAVLVKTNGEVVSLGDVGNSGDLPQDGGPVARGSLMPQVQALLPGQRMPGINQSVSPDMPVDPANMGHANPNSPWGDAAAAMNRNTDALNQNTAQTTAGTAATTRMVSGIGSDFGRLMNGQIDTTDVNRHWGPGCGEAHFGAPILGHYDLTDPTLQGAAVSKQQAIDLTGIADWQKAMAALKDQTLIATNSLTGLSTQVKAVDVGPGHNPAGAPQVELTGAANNQLQSYRGGNISLSLAGANVKMEDNPGLNVPGMPVLNRSYATGASAPNLNSALPHGTPFEGTAPAPNLGNITMDQDAIDKMVIEINNYNAALQRGLITQEEFNKRVDELRSKTISGLTDPNGGRNGVSYGQQINNQARNVGGANSQYDPQVTAHRLAMDKIMQDQKHADDLMKTNDEGVVDSFIAGVRKQALAAGTLDQAIGKVGSTIVSDLGSGIGNALDEITSGTKTAAQAFKDMAVSILKDISKMLIEFAILAIVKQIAGVGGGGGGGLGGAIASLAGGGGGGGAGAGMHSGGIVGSEATFVRNVDMSVFNGASRYHNGGILPGEVPIIAQQGEGVFTPEQMANLAPAGSTAGGVSSQQNSFATSITINADGSSTSQTKGTGSNDARETGRQLDALVKSTLVNETRKGGILDQWSSARARR